MRKILLSLGLLSMMALCCGAVAAADDDTPKKGKFGKLKDKLGKGNFGKGKEIDHEKLFAKLDTDKNEKLSKDEFRKVYQNLGGRIPEQLRERLEKQADAAFAKLDKDNDGSLSKEEFKEFRGAFSGNFGDLREKLKDKGLGDLLEKFKDKGFGKKKEEKKDN